MKKLMLDTHVLLWAIGNSNELSPYIKDYLTNMENEVFISAISIWEIALKHSLGKLELNFAIEDIPLYCKQMGFYLIPLMPLEALGFLNLPQKKNHRDPFDRMLIYQCIKNNYIFVSKDNKINFYKDDGLECIW